MQAPGRALYKTVEYEDINYSVASTEDQTAIFSGWSSFLNYFDSSLPFQLSFINRRSHSRSRYQVNIPKADDNYNSVRDEFTGMLKIRLPKAITALNAQNTSPLAYPPRGLRRHGPVWSVWRPMSWETLSDWAFPRSRWTDGPALRCFIARCTRGAVRRSVFVERHPADRARHKRLYCPGQSRLPPVPHIPHRPVLGRGVLLADYGIRAFG